MFVLKTIIMKQNLGTFDKVLRILLAIGIALAYQFELIGGVLAIILFVLGAVFALTSFAGICPLYLPFRLSTRKK